MNRHPAMRTFVLIILCTVAFTTKSYSQTHELNIGIKCQKAIHLYWENGITAEYTNPKLWEKRIHLGFSYTTSRLGTAWHSNAIKQDNYLLSGALHFRPTKTLQPIIKLNTGYFYSDMEYEIFKVLPHHSLLLSVEGGIGIQFKFPLKLSTSLGYNLITGNGLSGPGTLYPLFYQLSLHHVFSL